MAKKSIRELSAPTMDNIRTGPAMDIERSFELKPVLINMVQASQFYGKAQEDASAHLQHFLDAILLHLLYQGHSQGCHTTSHFPILTLGKSEVVVLCNQGEEYYMGTLFHQFSSKVLSHGQDQCSPLEDFKHSATT